jgi:hypothetical protein
VAACGTCAAAGDAGGGTSYPAGSRVEWASIILDAFRRGLAETGNVEGQNVTIDYRFLGDQLDRLPELAADRPAARGAANAKAPSAINKTPEIRTFKPPKGWGVSAYQFVVDSTPASSIILVPLHVEIQHLEKWQSIHYRRFWPNPLTESSSRGGDPFRLDHGAYLHPDIGCRQREKARSAAITQADELAAFGLEMGVSRKPHLS